MIRPVRRIKIAKLADEYLDRVLVYLLSWTRSFRQAKPGLMVLTNILFIKCGGIGSIILSEPALRSFQTAYPRAEIHCLTLNQNLDLFRFIPVIKKVHSLAFDGLVSVLRY